MVEIQRTPDIFVEIDNESRIQNSRGRPQLYAGGFQSVRGILSYIGEVVEV